MSLPNYLAKIKSAGIYRFVWDKSTAPIQMAETLRLVVGYSEKGPFNTPVYIDNVADFKTIFGNISKRLEKKGVYFHRMALQALEAGPILALNLKKFGEEKVQYVNLDPANQAELTIKSTDVVNIYNTDRFWSLDADVLPEQLSTSNYLTITTTDSKESSCTFFIRKYVPTGYDVTVKSWYSSRNEEIPTYFEGHEDMLLEDTFAEVYVFRGEFTPSIASTPELKRYFVTDVEGNLKTITVGDKEVPYLTSSLISTFGETVDTLETLADDENSNFLRVYRGTLIPYFKDNSGMYISLDLVFNKDNSLHKMLMKIDDTMLDATTDVTAILDPSSFGTAAVLPTLLDNAELYTETVEGEAGADENIDQYTLSRLPIYLQGYEYTTLSKSSTGYDIQQVTLDALSTYTGIRVALTNNIDSEYHYIVDTFRTYPGTSIKSIFSILAKEKDNCLALLNFPFMSDVVKECTNPLTHTFDAKMVKNMLSLPTANEGASWCAFYTAMTLSDGTVKTVCPSAAVVSNNFMEKYNTRHPYSIVAGPNYGLIATAGLVGPDYNFSRADLDFFEPFGVNCLVYVPRVGTQINSNQTAKQSPVSALSRVHVRELVIYLQDSIANMLQNYQWEFNTPVLRANVKAKADKILENVQQNGGVYVFRNTCDETNNTDDVINNEMLVLSTEIEPGMGAGKMVEELTIYRKGGMTSSAI